jgi:hypothetical protein
MLHRSRHFDTVRSAAFAASAPLRCVSHLLNFTYSCAERFRPERPTPVESTVLFRVFSPRSAECRLADAKRDDSAQEGDDFRKAVPAPVSYDDQDQRQEDEGVAGVNFWGAVERTTACP